MLKSKIKNFLLIPPYELIHTYKIYKLKKIAIQKINNYLKSNAIKKLQIGCGGNILPSWLNTDLILENEHVTFLDAGERFPLPDSSFDYVYSEHLFEHLTFSQQSNYLSETFRVLKPGGKIRIATPDLTKILSLWTDNSQFNKDYINWNFEVFVKNKCSLSSNLESKSEYVINNYMRDWGHQMIHSKSSLKEMVNLSGFNQIGFFEVGQSNDLCLKNIERHFEMIGVDNNVFETMILEASK